MVTDLCHRLLAVLLAGGVIGLVGGVFAVGTPYVAYWFDRSQQGMAMGVFGAGNVGAALNQLVAYVLLVNWLGGGAPDVCGAHAPDRDRLLGLELPGSAQGA